jgi:hypothetical protein
MPAAAPRVPASAYRRWSKSCRIRPIIAHAHPGQTERIRPPDYIGIGRA